MSLSSYKHIIDKTVSDISTVTEQITTQQTEINDLKQGQGLNIQASSIQVNGQDLDTTLNSLDARILQNTTDISNFVPQNMTANDLTYNGVNLKSVLDLEIAKISANEQNISDVQNGVGVTIDANNAIYDNTDPQNPVTVKDKLDSQDSLITDNLNEINDIKNDINTIQQDITDIQNNGSGGASTTADITHNGSQLDTVINTIQSDVSTLQSSGGGGSVEKYHNVVNVETNLTNSFKTCCVVGNNVFVHKEDNTRIFINYLYKNGNLEFVEEFLGENTYTDIKELRNVDGKLLIIYKVFQNIRLQFYSIDEFSHKVTKISGMTKDIQNCNWQGINISGNENYILGNDQTNKRVYVFAYDKSSNAYNQTYTIQRSTVNFGYQSCITNDGEHLFISSVDGIHYYKLVVGFNDQNKTYQFASNPNKERHVEMIQKTNSDKVKLFCYDSDNNVVNIIDFDLTAQTYTEKQTINITLNAVHKMRVQGDKWIVINEANKSVEIYKEDSNGDYVLDSQLNPNATYNLKDYEFNDKFVVASCEGKIHLWEFDRTGAGASADTTQIESDLTQLQSDVIQLQSDVSTLQSSGGSGGSVEEYRKIVDISFSNDSGAWGRTPCIVGNNIFIMEDKPNIRNEFSHYWRNGDNIFYLGKYTVPTETIDKIMKLNDSMIAVCSDNSSSSIPEYVSIFTIKSYNDARYTSLDLDQQHFSASGQSKYGQEARISISQNTKNLLIGESDGNVNYLHVMKIKKDPSNTFDSYFDEYLVNRGHSNTFAFWSNEITDDEQLIFSSVNGGIHVYVFDSNSNNYVFSEPKFFNGSQFSDGNTGERWLKIIEDRSRPNIVVLFAYQDRWQSPGENLEILEFDRSQPDGSQWTKLQYIPIHLLDTSHKPMIVQGNTLILGNNDTKAIEFWQRDPNTNLWSAVNSRSISVPTSIWDWDVEDNLIYVRYSGKLCIYKGLY